MTCLVLIWKDATCKRRIALLELRFTLFCILETLTRMRPIRGILINRGALAVPRYIKHHRLTRGHHMVGANRTLYGGQYSTIAQQHDNMTQLVNSNPEQRVGKRPFKKILIANRWVTMQRLALTSIEERLHVRSFAPLDDWVLLPFQYSVRLIGTVNTLLWYLLSCLLQLAAANKQGQADEAYLIGPSPSSESYVSPCISSFKS